MAWIKRLENAALIVLVGSLMALIYASWRAVPSFELRKSEWQCVKFAERPHPVDPAAILHPAQDRVCLDYRRIGV